MHIAITPTSFLSLFVISSSPSSLTHCNPQATTDQLSVTID